MIGSTDWAGIGRVRQAGDLFRALKNDRDGALRWNKKCDAVACACTRTHLLRAAGCKHHQILLNYRCGFARAGGPGMGRNMYWMSPEV